MEKNKKQLTKEQEDALKLAGALSATISIPATSILPFQDLIDGTQRIKLTEAQRLFPQADPAIFNPSKNITSKEIVPVEQGIANIRSFGKNLNLEELYRGKKFFPEYLNAPPGAPNPELGTYQQAIGNKAIFPEGDIQAITVTPGPNPSRFAQDYSEILADKLGKTHFQYEQFTAPGGPLHTSKGPETTKELARLENKLEVLSSKTPGTAGYVWGNINQPQYSYAEGNWGLGQKIAEENPAIYISRINADPSKEAKYLYTGDILEIPYKEPRARFKQYEDLGPGTGPSWGVTESKGSAGDIHFRKDLIGARGELTAGDLQALLAERNLPFVFQTRQNTPVAGRTRATKKPGDVLRTNLETLAKAEDLTPYQTIERFARLVPNVGAPSTPSTPAVTGRLSEFPAQGQAMSPFGNLASKVSLRQLGILPPSDKATYKAFTVDDFDTTFNYRYPRYGASTVKEISPSRVVEASIPGSSIFENDFIPGTYEVEINRDVLRPKAANKLLNKTVENLIKQSEPLRGLGIGGLATGAIATAADPAVIGALARGDYTQAGTTAAINTTIGSAIGGATGKGLQLLRNAGYARPAAAIGSALPLAGGVLAGLGAVETGKALNRVYKAQTGKDWVTRNQPASPYSTYAGPTPTIQPRMGTAILGGRPVQVPYGSVAGEKRVGRPWWDKAGSQFQGLLNRFNPIIGR